MCFRWVVSACVVVQLLASGSRSATAPEPKPVAKATAEQFVKEAVADPAAAEKKFKGKIIELTGPVSSTDGGLLTVKAGKLKPNDLFGLFAEAEVSAGQKDAVQMFAQDQKIQVTGELKSVSKDRVRLTNCKVKELER